MNESPRSSRRSFFQIALQDIFEGLRRRELWRCIGWNEIRQRYRRSLIGPFWITLSMGIMIAGLGVVYANLWNLPVANYLPYLATGLVFWAFISLMLNDGCQMFIGMSGFIRQIHAPLSLYLFQLVWRNLIILAHNFLIVIILIPLSGIAPNWAMLLILPGLLLLVFNCAWASLVLGVLSARYRDVPQVILNLLYLLFFVTPVIWTSDRLTGFGLLWQLNPLYHLLELVRAPLLGHVPSLENWLAGAGLAVIGGVFAIFVFGRYRSHIAYWV